MSKKYPSAAKNLEDALNNFNEQPSLFFEKKENPDPGESPDFYIERKDKPVHSISVFLKASRNDDKILFTGHMGSGKSTELMIENNDFHDYHSRTDKSEILNLLKHCTIKRDDVEKKNMNIKELKKNMILSLVMQIGAIYIAQTVLTIRKFL